MARSELYLWLCAQSGGNSLKVRTGFRDALDGVAIRVYGRHSPDPNGTFFAVGPDYLEIVPGYYGPTLNHTNFAKNLENKPEEAGKRASADSIDLVTDNHISKPHDTVGDDTLVCYSEDGNRVRVDETEFLRATGSLWPPCPDMCGSIGA